jgi:FixJ family two-component response regulator
MSTFAPTIFLADDDPAVRKALTRLLQAEGYRVRAYATGDALLAAWEAGEHGCVVADLAMPGLNGLQLQKALAASRKSPPVVFISGFATVSSSVEAMKNGAVDFLTKPVDDVDLLRAVRSAIARDRSVRAELDARNDFEKRLATLTPREREVLEHVVSGQLNKQIAGNLGTVEKTVKVHRARVMEKMGAHSVAELARECERAGMFEDVGSTTRSTQ